MTFDNDLIASNDPLLLTQALVRYPSLTPDSSAALDLIQAWCEARGFVCTRIPAESTSYPVDNLYCRWGQSAPMFAFAGHTDVVPVGDEEAWSQPPFAANEVNGKLIGRGTVDMKSGVACFMAAVGRLLEQGAPQGSIAFLITGDEEGEAVAGTTAILDWMRAHGEKADHCLVAEPSCVETLGDTIKIGRRGSGTGRLTVFGVQGHAAYPDHALNPLHPLLRMGVELVDTPLDQGNQHFQATSLQVVSIDVGNPANNIIPAEGQLVFNVRYNDTWTGERLEAEIRRRLDAIYEDYSLEFRSSGDAFVFEPDELGAAIARAVEAVTGQTPDYMTNGGTSDARFIKDMCPVAEFGAVGSSMHKVDEFVSIDELEPLTEVYRRLLVNYFEARA